MIDFDVTAERGQFRVQKVEGRRGGRRHMTFAAAETAAARLLEANPGETFVITQEVAQVARHVRTARGD